MKEKEKKEHIYAAIVDLQKELGNCVARLNIINRFLLDLVEVKSGKEPEFETEQTLTIKSKDSSKD